MGQRDSAVARLEQGRRIGLGAGDQLLLGSDRDMLKRTMGYVDRDGCRLALHCWGAGFSPAAVVFYIHGMQSHAGWANCTGESIASARTWVYVLDRRGSGLSGGDRGDVISLQTLLDDFHFALSLLAQRHPGAKVILVGQSLGGSILAGLLAWLPKNVDYHGAVFLSPALSQLHAKLQPGDIEIFLADKSSSLHKTNLLDENYTRDDAVLNFIRTDPLVIRHITKRSLSAYIELERMYMRRSDYISSRSLLLQPNNDPIARNMISEMTFRSITGNKGTVTVLEGDRHYLEFSDAATDVYELIDELICQVVDGDRRIGAMAGESRPD